MEPCVESAEKCYTQESIHHGRSCLYHYCRHCRLMFISGTPGLEVAQVELRFQYVGAASGDPEPWDHPSQKLCLQVSALGRAAGPWPRGP